MKKKILSAILALSMMSGMAVVPAFAEDAPNAALVSKYDTLVAEHTCEESGLGNLTIEENAPDGTKYIKTGTAGNSTYNNSKDEYHFQSEFTYGSNTKEDIMISLDIRFDVDGSGFLVSSDNDSKISGLIKNNGGKLAIQRSSNDFTTTSVAIDTTAWYHITLVGRYSAPDANIDMYVWKYNDDGTMEYLLKQPSIPLRNLSASNNNGASHIDVWRNTSVDNMRIYKLNADALEISSNADVVSAGESMLFTYSASRAGEYITNPAVTWEVYNEDNSEVLNDENISVSESGLLTIGGNATAQTINVRATAESGVSASKTITVDAIDTSTDTYDAVEISADKSTVRVGLPVTLTVKAMKDGAEVTPGEGDLFWNVYNAGNLRELGNDNITITDGVLSVTEDAVPQTVTVKTLNKSGSVSGSYQIEVLPANMNTGNEDEYTDTFVSAEACEEYISGATLKEGSWDGSAYYNVTAAYDFVGFPANTTEDVIYSADMQFANDGAGWTVFNANKGKLGLQLTTSGTKLNALGASNKVVGSLDIDKNAWYNVQVMCATGKGDDSYAICSVYKYDENGERVHPVNGEADTPYNLTVNLRNLSSDAANHINISAGTNVDNVMNFKVAPDKLSISVDAATVLAGGSAQAATTASRKGIAFPKLSNSLIKYEVYDADDKYPLDSNLISIDPLGKLTVDPMADAQDVYVRVSSVSGGMHDSKKLTIKSSYIFEITGAGFNDEDENDGEAYSILKRIDVTKNFDYNDDVSFVSAVYGADGAMKTIAIRKAYGDQLLLGSNRVSMNMAMPQNFNKETDSLRAFALTKLPVSKAVAPDETLTATKSASGISLTQIPSFTENSDVIILVLKTSDPTKVEQGDIAYFNQTKVEDIPSEIKIDGNYDGEYIVEIAGKINGVHTVKSASTANN